MAKQNDVSAVKQKDVKEFWEAHPLLGYELPYEPGTVDFFKAYDAVRGKDEFQYCFHLLNLLPDMAGKKVLDVGCGNGWILSQIAKTGMKLYGIDLTMKSIELSKARFRNAGIGGQFACASAEDLPFPDNTFDSVVSLGVIHHTPRTERCAEEIIRVCKPGGKVLIAVYYENLLLKKWFFPLTQLFLWILGRKDMAKISRQEFVNRYDGPDNPLGKIYDLYHAKKLVTGLEHLSWEVHYFPKRLVPGLARIPFGGHLGRFLDKNLGFLIYVHGIKKA